MKKLFRFAGIALGGIAIAWTLLTVWVELAGPEKSWAVGDQTAQKEALIVYDPDPFYNLDEQISRSFGQALADHGLRVRIATVAAAERLTKPVDLYVFCANTYNWRPDWALSNFIEKQALDGKSVIAITLGSGSTSASQRALEKLIIEKKGKLLSSRSLWLMKPNDKSRLKESNVKVSVSMAYAWGRKVAEQITLSPIN